MKKVFLSAALALAVAGSWAFYPKTEGPTGYMMVVARINYQYASILTIMPDGKKSTQEVTARLFPSMDKSVASFEALHEAELLKINSLKSTGWKITSATQSGTSANGIAETVYILEK